MSKTGFTEGLHYYFNDAGQMVLTALYLLEQGLCCGNGCLHCPYNYENAPESRREILRAERRQRAKQNATKPRHEGNR